VRWETLALGRETPLGALSVTALPIPGKRPLHLEGLGPPSPEDNVGFRIRHGDKTLAYLSAVAGRSPEVDAAVAGADCVFFDGTFWSSDELVAAGLGTRRAEDMAHWPVGGPAGSLDFLRGLPARRVLIHINNTNPLLAEDAPERRALAEAGIELAHDGMELTL
jgi:pyrroloquinoline quinone biosynthesis protein B